MYLSFILFHSVMDFHGTAFYCRLLTVFTICSLIFLKLHSNAFNHELTLLEKVRHPNVVQFVGAVTQNIPMMIVVEYHPKVRYISLLHTRAHVHKPLKYRNPELTML